MVIDACGVRWRWGHVVKECDRGALSKTEIEMSGLR